MREIKYEVPVFRARRSKIGFRLSYRVDRYRRRIGFAVGAGGCAIVDRFIRASESASRFTERPGERSRVDPE